jgi:prepilin-type N-terminal cleavage/methylation domain-containing protein
VKFSHRREYRHESAVKFDPVSQASARTAIPPARRYAACLDFVDMPTRTRQSAFTLVEIMIVVAIIAMLAAIAVPNFLRARKRSQSTHILNDLRIITGAIDQYAIENHKATGDAVNWTDIKRYLKTGSKLYNTTGTDMLGGIYVGYSVDSIPKLRAATFAKLSDVAPSDFWSPYYP